MRTRCSNKVHVWICMFLIILECFFIIFDHANACTAFTGQNTQHMPHYQWSKSYINILSTGWASLIITSIIWIHLFFDFVISIKKGQTYFLTKDFVTVLVLFVIVPVVLIIRSEKMSKYVLQHITSNQYFLILASIYERCSAMLPNKRDRNNTVTPLPNIENMVFIDDSQRITHI